MIPRRALLILAVFATAACTRDQWQRFPSPDDVVAKVPWFSTMHRGLAIQPYAIPSRRFRHGSNHRGGAGTAHR